MGSKLLIKTSGLSVVTGEPSLCSAQPPILQQPDNYSGTRSFSPYVRCDHGWKKIKNDTPILNCRQGPAHQPQQKLQCLAGRWKLVKCCLDAPHSIEHHGAIVSSRMQRYEAVLSLTALLWLDEPQTLLTALYPLGVSGSVGLQGEGVQGGKGDDLASG